MGLSFRGTEGLRYQKTEGELYKSRYSGITTNSVRWRRGGLEDNDLYVEGTVATQEQNESYEMLGVFKHPRGAIDTFGNMTKSNNSAQTSYGSNFLVNFLASENGVNMGGAREAQSAVHVKLDAYDKDIPFAISFNGNARGIIKTGQSRVFPVNPYREYMITISPADDTVTDFVAKPQKTVTFPGNITEISWVIEKKLVIMGRALNVKGEALAEAFLREVREPTYTDEEGFFQVEVSSQAKTISLEITGGFCSMSLEQAFVGLTKESSILDLGDIVCK